MDTTASKVSTSMSLSLDAEQRRYVRRKATSVFMAGLITSLTVIAVAILILIVILITINGIGAISITLFTKDASEGGIAHAIIGTIEMLAVAGLIAVPVGVLIAVYLSEIGHGWFAELVHLTLDLLAQLPSIVVGLFILVLFIYNGLLKPSGVAGALALVMIMLPIVARTVEEILRLVPDSLREGALALGTPRWKVTLSVVIPTVLPGIVTGIILAMARAAGETAPLLLTALGTQFFEFNLTQPMSAIPLQLYNDAVYATDDASHARAWAAGLVLIVVVALISGTVRFITGRLRHES